ncbi:MAG: chemotaxis protein CheR [Deltaproteobacteria bacterium]|nr:chemotaxis protein CheR [Deltaproteobacteria bacterium]
MTELPVETFYHPSLSAEQARKNLSALLLRGAIKNSTLDTSITRLERRFQSYCALYPHGLWAPGLMITSEMRGLTEQYLPMAEIRAAFRHFFSLALHYPLPDESNPIHSASSWLDLLQRLHLTKESANPAALLRKLIIDEDSRVSFLFSVLLPEHHGGSFLRYPEQIDFLKSWISRRSSFFSGGIRCLDAACGTGEGTYDIAELLQNCGIPAHDRQVHGCSLEALEVFTAAHGCFPHDPERQRRFRTRIEPLFIAHGTDGMVFFRDTILRQPTPEEQPYDVILCNGLLGGPFLHEPEMLEKAIKSLGARLKTGGILLAADRFHGGWRKENPPTRIVEIMQRIGLTVRHGEYGIAAEKK